jgi:hypothetical protein
MIVQRRRGALPLAPRSADHSSGRRKERMAGNAPDGMLARLGHSVLLRVAVYYAALGTAVSVGWGMLPPRGRAAVAAMLAPVLSLPTIQATSAANFDPNRDTVTMALAPVAPVAVAILSAILLSLPIAWVYMFTRQKKGYQPSVVQTLVLLPAVVAGVVELVKNSIPLAFSLAGIVAAVKFRTTLDDSKDAVFVFLATALGLAAGVQLAVATLFSMLFVVVMLVMFYSDFARLPPSLEGVRAQRQMERALALANRTSQFVARIDQEVLQAMAPAQLEALQDRLQRRRADIGDDTGDGKFDTAVRVETTDDAMLRSILDPWFEINTKRWRFRGTSKDESGRSFMEYEVRLRKGVTRDSFARAVQSGGEPYVVTVETEKTDT